MRMPRLSYLFRRRRRWLVWSLLLAIFTLVIEPLYHVHYAYDFPRPEYDTDPPFFDTCPVPLDEIQNTTRQSAALMMLARNSDIDTAVRSVRNLENNFNRWFQYPWVFLNDRPWEPRFVELIKREIRPGTRVVFDTISPEDWGWPAEFGERERATAVRSWDRMVAGMTDEFVRGTQTQKASYHHMCRWNSGLFYDHPAMREFRWYWRVEPGVSFTCDIPYDPFHHMARNNKTYGYTIALWEVAAVSPGLFRATSDFADRLPGRRPAMWQAMHEPSWAPWPVRRLVLPWFPSKNARGDGWSACHFWSNFEIADLDFYRSDRYRDYFAHLDGLGGFYYERWGDAPIHSLAAAMLLEPQQIHWFQDIGYRHPPMQYCPADGIGCQCSCNHKKEANAYCSWSLRRTVEPEYRYEDWTVEVDENGNARQDE